MTKIEKLEIIAAFVNAYNDQKVPINWNIITEEINKEFGINKSSDEVKSFYQRNYTKKLDDIYQIDSIAQFLIMDNRVVGEIIWKGYTRNPDSATNYLRIANFPEEYLQEYLTENSEQIIKYANYLSKNEAKLLDRLLKDKIDFNFSENRLLNSQIINTVSTPVAPAMIETQVPVTQDLADTLLPVGELLSSIADMCADNMIRTAENTTGELYSDAVITVQKSIQNHQIKSLQLKNMIGVRQVYFYYEDTFIVLSLEEVIGNKIINQFYIEFTFDTIIQNLK